LIKKPKLLVIGHAQHGKDSACETLVKYYNLAYESSSHFAARKFIFDEIKDHYKYNTVEECVADRVNHRRLWYDMISNYNYPDPARLGKELYKENDVYCGLRHKREFNSMKNQGVFDCVLWVDRSDHMPPEDKSSMTLEPWMADFIIDNNGTKAELEFRVCELIDYLLPARYGLLSASVIRR
jgi:hypothetical protein